MVVYIEYALIENFAVDFLLFYLTGKIIKGKFPIWRLVLVGAIGGGFAVLFPLLRLNEPFSTIVKFLLPLPLCAVAFYEKRTGQGREKLKNHIGRYLFSVGVFFALSFAYAGGLIAVFNLLKEPYIKGEGGYILTKIPVGCSVLGLVGFFIFIRKITRAIYKRREKTRFIYPCQIRVGKREERVDCFLDSGNLVKIGNAPVCFVSADVFFSLRSGAECAKAERIKVLSIGGERWVNAYPADEFKIYLDERVNKIERVYFSFSERLLGRDYKILVGAWATE